MYSTIVKEWWIHWSICARWGRTGEAWFKPLWVDNCLPVGSLDCSWCCLLTVQSHCVCMCVWERISNAILISDFIFYFMIHCVEYYRYITGCCFFFFFSALYCFVKLYSFMVVSGYKTDCPFKAQLCEIFFFSSCIVIIVSCILIVCLFVFLVIRTSTCLFTRPWLTTCSNFWPQQKFGRTYFFII